MAVKGCIKFNMNSTCVWTLKCVHSVYVCGLLVSDMCDMYSVLAVMTSSVRNGLDLADNNSSSVSATLPSDVLDSYREAVINYSKVRIHQEGLPYNAVY